MRGIIICLLFPLWSAGQFKPEKRAILNNATLRDISMQCSRKFPWDITSVRPLTNAEVDSMEQHFLNINDMPRDSLKAPYEFVWGIHKTDSLHLYAFQYVGVMLGDRKGIYINAFPKGWFKKDDGFDPTREILGVCDGGASYWGVVYELATQQFIYLYYNGAVD